MDLPSQGDDQASFKNIEISSSSSLSDIPTSNEPQHPSTAAIHQTSPSLSTGLPSHYRMMDDGPAIKPPPTFKEQIVEILEYIRSKAQGIDKRNGQLAILALNLVHLAIVFVGLVVLAYDPYHDRRPTLSIVLMVSIILTHVYLLEQMVRWIAFGSEYFIKNAWNALDALIVGAMLLGVWLLRMPESIMVGVLVGGRMWRMLMVMRVDKVFSEKQVHFESDQERLEYLGSCIRKEKQRDWDLRDEVSSLKKKSRVLGQELEISVNAVLKANKR